MESNQQIPLCKSCEFFDGKELCLHARSMHVVSGSLVRGPVEAACYSAEQMREFICGPLGKLYAEDRVHRPRDPDYAHAAACAKAGVSEEGPSR